ncbi:MAG TPA: cystathionine beta-lyase [Vitreimonas sp.]|uniref:cystathionine beta-lyase n=1 Tax=Vitreimonas sp. TaxID=3069702 RepID=UPI002D5C6E9C|nr:cystathionine beta-lyase [Vitreimonas sp.]HYD87432.1 cystathionine beta-lyase [Vitreimonas sp.]
MARAPLDFGKLRLETRLAHAGRDRARSEGAVNPPVHRATTLLIDDPDDLYGGPKKTYGIDGMAVQQALREALVAIEGGVSATLTPSGLAACTLALMTVAKAGGELLVTDALYAPTRRFCETTLKRFGVKTRYIDPRSGAGIADLITDETCGVFLESPGTHTFEVMDVPAIAAAARARNLPVVLDNTWSAGVYFKPFEHGVDISVQALTKYQSGHADAFVGAVLAGTSAWAERVNATNRQLGLFASPDDCYLLLRGLRTLGVRLERQSASALSIAQWLEARPEIARVIHPALPSHPDHAIWNRDFSGASGVFSCQVEPAAPERLKAMLEGFSIFAMGFSWGGYESLIVPSGKDIRRVVAKPSGEGTLLRLSIGLEHPDDLIADLEAGLARLRG